MIKPEGERSTALLGYLWVVLLAVSQLLPTMLGFSSGVLTAGLFFSALFFFLILRLNTEVQWSDYELYGIVGVVSIAALTQQIHYDSGLIRFIWDGLIQHYDINPYQTVPSSGDVMGLQTEPIYPFLGKTGVPTPFSPFLLILAKFSGWIYLASKFSVSILVTKFIFGTLTVISLFWGYQKGLFTQSFLLILLLNPFTLFLIGQGQPLLMLFPILILALHQWKHQDDLTFWLIWGIVWFLSPVGIIISLLFSIKTKGVSLIGIITYVLWWLPFISLENVTTFFEQSLLQVPDITLISSLFTISELLSQSLFYLSYASILAWTVWTVRQSEINSKNLILLTIPLFLLPSDTSAFILIIMIAGYALTELKTPDFGPHFTVILTIVWLTTLLTIVMLAKALALTYSTIIPVQLLILVSLIFVGRTSLRSRSAITT